jgi:hypothetical protein
MAVMYKENEWKEILCTTMISVKVQETVKINFSPTAMSLKLLTPTKRCQQENHYFGN